MDSETRIEELEATVADLRQNLLNLSERFRSSFYARHDQRYSGIAILDWLEAQVKTILTPTPSELRSELLARQGRISNALAGVLAVWDNPTEQGLQDAMQTLKGAMDDFQKAGKRARFSVIDLKTGQKPDLVLIAREEDWAKHLMWMDMESFAIDEDGDLILMDECGNMAYCPEGRFRVEWK